jgi:hypothetical protein
MSRGALTLAMYPFDEVRICCEPYGREVRDRRNGLIERFGADMSMPEVLGWITADCPLKRPFGAERCRAIYPDLVGQSAGAR